MRYVNRWFFVLFLGLLLGAAACQPTNNNAETGNNNGEANGGSEATETLVIYSGRSETLVQPIIDQFQEETDIQVEVRYGGTAEIAATLLEEGDNSPADLFFAQDPGGLGAIQEAGLLADLPDDILALVPARFASPDQQWVGISGRARVVVYNTDTLTPADLPTDLQGFTDPQWQGRIGLPPTNGSFQTMVTALRSVWGEEATRTWLEGIMANEPIFYEKNTPVVAAVGAGEVEVGFVNHYYLYRFLAEEGESFAARNYFLPDGGPGSLIMVAGAGVLANADNSENAQRLIAFLLSPEGQQYFTDQTYEYPVIDGVAINPLLQPLSEIDAVAANIALGDLADLEGTARLLSEVGMLP